MRRALALWLSCAVAGSGCVAINEESRLTRGPLLRTYERNTVHPSGGIQAKVAARWPELTLTFAEFDRCRLERVEEYAEDEQITRSAPSFGPALALGVCGTLAGAGLLAARGAFSNEPDRQKIDGAGNYAAPPRQIATAWGAGALAVGLPALAVAAIGHLRSGTETKSRRAEEISSATDTPCHHRPVDGQVEFLGQGSTPAGKRTAQGTVVLTAQELRGSDFDTVLLDGRAAVAPAEDAARLSAFGACLEVLPPPGPDAVAKLTVPALKELIASAEACAAVPEAPVASVGALLKEELARRERTERPAARFKSYEEALAAQRPRAKVGPGDTAALEKDGPVVLTGILLERLSTGEALVEVGARRVLVSADPQSAWAANLRPGSRVEVVGTLKGQGELRGQKLPRLEADWARTAL